jgi:hypothetical protein
MSDGRFHCVIHALAREGRAFGSAQRLPWRRHGLRFGLDALRRADLLSG